jgi:hypothetical protein
VDKVFVIDVIDLLGLHNFVLVEKLERDVLAGFLVLGHLHLPETTCMDYFIPFPRMRPTS